VKKAKQMPSEFFGDYDKTLWSFLVVSVLDGHCDWHQRFFLDSWFAV
jgi:hypothetical protein